MTFASPPRRVAALLTALVAAGAFVTLGAGGPSGELPTSGAAWQAIDLQSRRVEQSRDEDALRRPSQPGSVMKLPALIAALESGVISPDTRIACPGYAEIDGRRVMCLHQRVRRPLRPAEALSYSCNHYFATVGARLSRARLNAVLARLGLPAAPAASPMPLVATGLAATPVPPLAVLEAFARVLSPASTLRLSDATRTVVLDGLRGAAVFGTAAALGGRGIPAYAKTGTADGPGGGEQGMAVVAWPAPAPQHAAIVLVAGAGGPEAARVASILVSGAARGRTTAAPPSRRAAAAAQPAASGAGAVRVGHAQAGGRYVVRTYDIEDYVARVLAGEAPAQSPAAALEALAITVRTFARANRGRHAREGFDLCDLTHCQVLREPTTATRAAAEATRGLVLAWHGAPASVYYTASCGGRTERPSNVWPGADDPPFLPMHDDPACAGEPHWSSEISARDLERALRAAGYGGGRLRDVRIAGRNASGRVVALAIRGMTPSTISGQSLRLAVGRTLGWNLIKSTAFDLTPNGPGYRFEGHGFGHGVGYCVIGATRRAAAGASRDAVLAAYFPGVSVVNERSLSAARPVTAPASPSVPLASGEEANVDAGRSTSAAPSAPRTATNAGPSRAGTVAPASAGDASAITGAVAESGVRVILPEADERDRAMILAVARTALAGAAARTGRPIVAAVTLVFHPTSDSFTRETGEAWWSSAVTRGTRIDLQPVTVLRQRGLLEATISHELGHVTTEPSLGGRPEWVKEGAAMFASGELGESTIVASRRAARAACPSDAELRRPASAGAARYAYDRARQCFARALADGNSWGDVR